MKTSRLFLTACLLVSGPGCSSPPPREEKPAPITRCCPERPVVLKPDARNVGVLVFDDVFITEFSAPFDVYKHAGDKMNVFTVAPTKNAIRTYEGVALHPDFGFADAPRIDVLVVPSGNGSTTTDLDNQALQAFVQKTSASAELVTSHCWGAFTLARAGLLDGREATTFPTSIGDLQAKFPNVKAQTGPRFCVSGKFVTSNGGLAAYEAALFVVEKLYGKELADKVASGLVFAPDNRRLAVDPATAK
jgi:transcriptional regulator GlxA family with amidase domain